MMRDPDNSSAVSDAMSGRRDPSQTLERKFLAYAESHRQHYLALANLQAEVSKSLAELNAEREELFRSLRTRAEALDDASSTDRREIVAPLPEGDR